MATLKPVPEATDFAASHTTTTSSINPSLLWLIGLSLVLIGVFVLSLAVGSVSIPLDQIVSVLLGGEAEKASWTNIILKFRLPKALTALLAGAALSVSGLMMQTLFRNPLAGPYILGISSGASLGVALVVLSTGAIGTGMIAGMGFSSDLTLAGAAAVGAMLTMGIMLLVANRLRSTATLLILGLMVGYLTSAAVSLLLYFALPERIQAYLSWTFGSFNSVTWSQMQILAPVVVCGLLLASGLAKSLNALLLGESYARSMGLHITRTRMMIVIVASILAGTVTAFCGPIGFVGVAVPHLCRGLLNTSDHHLLLPASIIMGGVVALVAALLAEVPGANIVLPLNAITAVIGAPVVISVVLRHGSRKAAFAS